MARAARECAGGAVAARRRVGDNPPVHQRSVLVGVVAVALAAVASFALYNAFYLAPAYTRLVVEHAERDAERVATHLAAQFFGSAGLREPLEKTPAFRTAVAERLAVYGLERLKAFAPDGTVVFSTDPAEEGTRNTKPYFVETVARGRRHTVVVRRGGRSQEGRRLPVDVVETYVPVTRGGRFAGAFEVYYDVTEPLAQAAALLARSNLIVLLAAGVLTAAVAVSSRRALLAMRERERLEAVLEQRSAALEDANRRLHELSGHLQTAREEERTRVAREIHDELGQSLTAMRMELSLLRRSLPAGQRPATERADSLGAIVEATTQAVKRISQDLRPGVLDHLGLAAAVEWQAEEFEKRTGIPCSVTVDPVDFALEEQRSTALFRILQEALTNVARHAQARGASVALRRDGGDALLEVQDDGRGPGDRRAPVSTFGIIGMQERVRPWGGSVRVDGGPGQGTSVTVRIPVAGERTP